MKLGVNIDHIATLRQARYAASTTTHNVEPDLIAAAAACEAGGAHGITIHLRADRRHVQDADVFQLREAITTRLNLELGNTPEIVEIALRVLPDEVCLVPEHRREITTEGGLDAAGQIAELTPTIRRLQSAGIRVSLFIEPAIPQIEAARALGAEIVELHTGAYANAIGDEAAKEFQRLHAGCEHAHGLGLRVNAGHGINYANIREIRTLPHLAELNIGHSIVSRAVFTGLEIAVAAMVNEMNPAA